MFLNLARNSFFLSTMTFLGSGYLVSHASSTKLASRSTQEATTACISIQPVAGSITVITCKYTDLPDLLVIWNYFPSPFGMIWDFFPPHSGVNWYLPIRSTHSVSHGLVSASLRESFPCSFLFLFRNWQALHLIQTLYTVFLKFFQ